MEREPVVMLVDKRVEHLHQRSLNLLSFLVRRVERLRRSAVSLHGFVSFTSMWPIYLYVGKLYFARAGGPQLR